LLIQRVPNLEPQPIGYPYNRVPFLQDPPALANQYRTDRVLRSYLARVLPPEVLRAIEPELDEMGELAAGPLYRLQLADRRNEPVLTQWNPWGRRIDHVEVSPLWHAVARIAAERGLVAIPYERLHGEHARVHQMALAYLFDPSSDVYTCPLAMSDGAAKTLLAHDNRALIELAVPRLTSRDPGRAWTSGQWMTERTGGSDVSHSETIAAHRGDLLTLRHGRAGQSALASSQSHLGRSLMQHAR